MDIDYKELCKLALEMRTKSYCPYSNFAVGAALLCKDGRIFTGCNIENSSFTPTVCAERTAIFKAVSEGFKKGDFLAIAIAGNYKDKEPEQVCPPCGVCRQVMKEFCGPDFKVVFVKNPTEYEVHDFGEVFPFAFGNENFEVNR